MKLPTLNVDVKVNTAGMKKQVAEANKQLQGIGGKGLAFAGGAAGKLGSLGALGGTAGSLAIGAGGIALAAAAPVKLAGAIMDSFRATVTEANKTLSEFAKTGKTTTMSAVQAASIAAAAGPQDQFKPTGFFGGISRGFGSGGESVISNWASNLEKGASWLGTFIGASLGNLGGQRDIDEIMREADLSVVGSEQEARTLYSREELRELDRQMAAFQRQMRETTT